MTSDESWFCHSYEWLRMSRHERDEAIPRELQTMGSKSQDHNLYTGLRLLKLMRFSQGQKCNKDYFIYEILDGSNKEYNRGAGGQITKTMKIHMDNSRVQNALETAEKIQK
jgi:hypothetical protein